MDSGVALITLLGPRNIHHIPSDKGFRRMSVAYQFHPDLRSLQAHKDSYRSPTDAAPIILSIYKYCTVCLAVIGL